MKLLKRILPSWKSWQSVAGPWVALGLALGLAGTTGLAGAETGASLGDGDLASLIDSKLRTSEAPSTTGASNTTSPVAPAAGVSDGPIDTALRLALFGVLMGGVIFLTAFWVKHARERRIGEVLGSNLSVKESVWIGKGQRILVLNFEKHRVLIGVSGGALHNLGVFGDEGDPRVVTNPIERAAARKETEGPQTASEFSEFIKGELAESLSGGLGEGQDRRRKMISELNAL